MTKIIVTNLTDETGLHTENCSSVDGVGCGSACHKLHSHRLESLPDLVSSLHVDMLHAAFREMEFFQECVVGKYRQNVCQGVSNAKY